MHAQNSRWLMIALILCLCLPLFCQYNLTTLQQVDDKYNDLGKSFQVVINPMVEDSLGFIWIGSKKGLCRYSGSTIKCFSHIENDPLSIRSNNIENLFLDSDHNIWVALLGKGIDVFNIRGEKIKEFKYENGLQNGLKGDRVWGIFEDGDGYIWLSYFSGGISRYDRKENKFEHFSIDDEKFLETERPKTVVKIIPHSSELNTYWLSTTRGLVKFNTRTQEYEHFMFTSKIPRGLSESTFNDDVLHSVWNRDMILDSDGILWLSNFGGVVRFDPSDYSYEVIYYKDGEFARNGVGLFEMNDSTILISVNSGLIYLDKRTLSIKTLSKEKGFGPSYDLNTRIYKSNNGCLYFISAASKGTGIHKVCDRFRFVKNYDFDTFLESIVSTENYVHYYQKDGNIASKNLTTGEEKTTNLGSEKVRTFKYLYDLEGDTILIATINEVYKYHPSGYLKMISSLNIDNTYRIESLLLDSEKDIWSGRQRDGIFVYDVSEEKVIHYNHRSSPSIVYQDYIRTMTEDSEGDIWICTEQGWSIFNKKSNTTRNYFSNEIASKFGIDMKVIVDIVEAPNGYFYIADNTYGIHVWDKEKELIVKSLNRANGLKAETIYDLNLDENLIWISEEGALSVIDTETDSVRSFGREFGILKTPYFSTSDHLGFVYATHESGYYKIDKEGLLSLRSEIPQPIFTGFKVYESWADSLVYSEQKIDLNSNENFFTFQYGSLNYNNPWEEKYQYQLEGVDKDWIDAKGQRYKGYTDIRPGNYKFKVRVRTNGSWSNPIAKVLKINPAWYETWWFIFLLGASIIGIGIVILRNYIKNKRKEIEYEKRFAQLETMILKSQMNPHFIFNSLNSIRYLFMVDKKEKGLKYITKFAKLLRTTLHHGEKALINLVDEIELTELFIELEQLRFDDEFTFSSNYSENDDWKIVKIPPFVIQPIVENAFWHGLSQSDKLEKNIDIAIKKEKDSWWISIEDNGIGMTKSKPTVDVEVNKKKSYGLNIIRERFELINKTEKMNYQLFLENRDDNKSGTKVSIKISPK